MWEGTRLRNPLPVPKRRVLKATLIAWLVGSAIDGVALQVFLAIKDGFEGITHLVLVFISLYVQMLMLSGILVLVVAVLTYAVAGWLLETDRDFPEIAGLIVIPSAAITFVVPLVLFPFSIELVTGLLYFVAASLPYSVCAAYVIVRTGKPTVE